MKSKFTYLRESMKTEFEWLRKQFPVSYFGEIKLRIYNTGSEQSSAWEEEKNACLMYDIDEPKDGCDIVLFLNMSLKHDEMDEKMMEKYELGNSYDIYFFMLYHEFGHLLDMSRTYLENGFEGLYEKLEDYEEQRKDIENLWDAGFIEEAEAQFRYRKLTFETNADNFAYEIYHKRIELIREYIVKMEA